MTLCGKPLLKFQLPRPRPFIKYLQVKINERQFDLTGIPGADAGPTYMSWKQWTEWLRKANSKYRASQTQPEIKQLGLYQGSGDSPCLRCPICKMGLKWGWKSTETNQLSHKTSSKGYNYDLVILCPWNSLNELRERKGQVSGSYKRQWLS